MDIFGRKNRQLDALKAELADLREKAVTMTDPAIVSLMNWQTSGETTELKDAYTQIPTIYAAVSVIARSLSQVPYEIRDRNDEPVARGPVVDLFADVNPYLSSFQLWEGIATSLELRGNAYLVKDEQTVRGIPVALWLVHPDEMTLATNGQGYFVGYWRTRNGRKTFLQPDQVIHIRYFNIGHEITGLSPLDVLKLTAESEWNAIQYNRHFFLNNAVPNIVYQFQRLGKNERARLEQDIIESRKGVENSHSAMIVEGQNASVQSLGISQKDMEFLDGRKFSQDEVCMIYGVPKSKLGLYEESNYNNAKNADLAFWKNTVIPMGRLIEDKIDTDLLRPLGYQGRFNFQAIDVLNEEFLDKIDAAVALLEHGFTRNEVNERLGLGFEDAPWGDEPMTPPSQNPFGLRSPEGSTKGPPALPIEQPEAQPPEGSEEIAKHVLAKRWNELSGPIQPVISRTGSAVRKYFYKIEQKLYRRLAKSAASVRTKDWENEVDAVVNEIDLDRLFEDSTIREEMRPYYEQAMERGIQTVTGVAFDLEHPEAVRILGEVLDQISVVNETAREKVRDIIGRSLRESITDGLSEEAKARKLTSDLGEKFREIKSSARTIARTEVHKAWGTARYAAAEETRPKYKRWISSRDSRVRDSHEHLDGKKVAWDADFSNGLKFPSEPGGAAKEVINCRCTYEVLYE
jgi:HK97 family phage portal protein